VINLSKKILVQIDTFPNTRDKIELTKLSITSLKKLGYPILLTSHIDIPKDLSDMVDYHYSDGNNILLPSCGDVNFFEYYTDSFKMIFKVEDIESHAPSVITGWFNGISFSARNGFDWLLKVEYDFIPNADGILNLKNELEKSKDKMGFLMRGSGEYISTRCIFGNVNFLFHRIYKTIIDWSDYYYWSEKLLVPVTIRRIAPIFTYYSLKNYLEDFVEIFESEDELFRLKKMEEYKNAFPGFIKPLISDAGNFFLCSYGMGWPTTKCSITDSSGNILYSSNINLSGGFWSFSALELSRDEIYYLFSDIETLVFNYDDVLNKKFGEIIFN
jgi:hypothetical protein